MRSANPHLVYQKEVFLYLKISFLTGRAGGLFPLKLTIKKTGQADRPSPDFNSAMLLYFDAIALALLIIFDETAGDNGR